MEGVMIKIDPRVGHSIFRSTKSRLLEAILALGSWFLQVENQLAIPSLA